ncbi:MBL fold metallo-hydrolase [Pontibacter sp. G13]|uniref:MBL fold metallo-hydrolase n=1 Tax=Pontibacter sp. G13 TaxID=3074898 RepID=UPI00288B366A|nr:MBL fold metallo-hydrolase [Pontibacter sp. G13]WNJ17061.1 MBL fold metallo-hydrolase [Pontibacter sp. G13]
MVLLFSILAITGIGTFAFMKLSPQFGQIPEGEDLKRIEQSTNYEDGIFVNLVETTMDMDFSKLGETMQEYMNSTRTTPAEPLPTHFDPTPENLELDSLVYVTWYGHSAILLEMEGKHILIDPMFGAVAAPVSFFGRRFKYQEPIDIDALPHIDAVIISHDHYDHLDYPTISKIKEKVGHFYTPLGVGSHLKSWEVPADHITELDWWQSAQLDSLTFTATPSRHFSGRGFGDRSKTQWASWVIKGQNNNIYFSGDGGYGPHFKEIGEKLGPFDFTMMECGQYNEKWAQIHMMPEETAQAHLDVQGKAMMPIHWGAFQLASHSWTDPVERVQKASEANGIDFVSPRIGQRFEIHESLPHTRWWEELE